MARMSGILTWVVLVSGACAARAPALDAQGKAVEVVGVLDSYEAVDAASLPEPVAARILEALGERNFAPGTVEGLPAGTGKTTALRIEALGEGSLTLLVETNARFYSQLGGRYRWVVHVDATLFGAGRPRETESFDVPVFLRFDHEREEAAVVQAAPIIGRRVGTLVDRTLPAS
jgi:hypothetical protein